MASKAAEIQKQLKRNGWKLLRNGTKHYVFEKNGRTMLIPKGSKIYSRSYKQILWKIQGKTDKSKSELLNPHTDDG